MDSPLTITQMPPGRNKLKHTIKNKRIHFQYTEEALAQAVQAIRTENKSVREACRHYGVPRSTVQDRISGRSKEQPRKVGPEPILGIDGEQKVVDWITELAKCGIPVSKEVLLENVAKIIKNIGRENKFPEGRLGQTWYQNFLRRHPEISVREPESINKDREAIINRNNIKPNIPKRKQTKAKESDSDIINTDKDIEINIKKTKVIEKTDKLNIIKKVDIKEINKISEDKIDKEMSHKSETAIDVTKTIPSDETFKRYDIYEEDEDDHEFDIF
ncbi:unnamed protein product, partial [Brenthis ino]